MAVVFTLTGAQPRSRIKPAVSGTAGWPTSTDTKPVNRVGSAAANCQASGPEH